MIKLRKTLTFLFVILLMSIFVACASSKGITKDNPANEEKSLEKEVRFNDWKYKGFGYELPFWVEDAVDGKLTDRLVLIERGLNSDQSENKIMEKENSVDKNLYELIGSTWVKEEKTDEYISIRIYKLKEEEVIE